MISRRELRVVCVSLAMLGLGSGVPNALAQGTPSRGSGTTGEQATPQEPVRNIAEWDLPKRGEKLAIQGYDPVAYFPEGGGKPIKGSERFTHAHKGVVYRFASQANMELFKQAPARYEPAHGGWCSWAMADDGSKVEINPKSFVVKDNRLFLFYDGFWGDTRKQWLKQDHAGLATKADRAWKTISREDKREVKRPAAETDQNGQPVTDPR